MAQVQPCTALLESTHQSVVASEARIVADADVLGVREAAQGAAADESAVVRESELTHAAQALESGERIQSFRVLDAQVPGDVLERGEGLERSHSAHEQVAVDFTAACIATELDVVLRDAAPAARRRRGCRQGARQIRAGASGREGANEHEELLGHGNVLLHTAQAEGVPCVINT